MGFSEIIGAVIGYGLVFGFIILAVLAVLGACFYSPSTDEDDEPLTGISKIIINIKYEKDDDQDISDPAQTQVSQTASSALPESEDGQNPTA